MNGRRRSTLRRLRPPSGNLLLVLAATALVFALAEAGARVCYHPENLGTVIRFDRHLGWSLEPRARLHSVDRTRHLDYTVQVNSVGMREREFDPAAKDGRRRILFVGDSFSFGVGVDASRRLSDFVARALPDDEVLNASVCGWGTDQELIHYERFGRSLRPDVVVLTFCMSNDVLNNMFDHLYLGTAAKPRFVVQSDSLVLARDALPKPQIAHRHRLRQWVKKSRLALFVKRRLDATRARGEESEILDHYHPGYDARDAVHPHSHWSVFERETDAEMEQAWRVTEMILERFARDCREDGADLIVLAFPLQLEVDDAWRERAIERASIDPGTLDIERPFRRLEAICKRLGVAYVHPLEEFRQAARLHRLYFEKDVHPNPFGHATAARAVLDLLRERHGMAYAIAEGDLAYLPPPAK